MASPRLICKSAYITSIEHFFNSIEYAGNKIHKQEVVYRDGSIREVEGDKAIKLTSGEQLEVLGVRITFKDGKVSRPISYDRYLARVGENSDRVTVSQVSEVSDDAQAFGIDIPHVDDAPRNLWDMSFDKYIGYIANREGVVKEEGHGLFGLSGNIPIDEAKALALEHENSRKWSHIISMDTEDAKSTGYDNRDMWKHLIVAKAPEIAKAYNIRLQNLVINCAYHGNTDNPHVHLMFYSKDHTEGFVKGGTAAMNKATEKLKSTLVGEIFKGENASLGAEKDKLRKQIMATLKCQVSEVMKEPLGSDIMDKIEALSVKLETAQGKKEYEWLPPELKQEVDDVLRTAIDSSPQLTQAFNEYSRTQEKMIARYVISPERLEEKLTQWKDSFLHPRKSDLKQHHNIIVNAAANIEKTRSQWLRTFGEENVHVNMVDESLSSTSVLEDADELPDSVSEYDYLLQSEPAMERTFGEEMFDFGTDRYSMSSSNYEQYYNMSTKKHREVLQHVNSIVVKELWRKVDNLDIYALRQLWSLQSDKTNDEQTGQLTCNIYFDLLSPELRSLLSEGVSSELMSKLPARWDSNLIQVICNRVEFDTYHGELPSATYIINRFAAELDTHLAEAYLKQQLKHPAVKQFRSELYQSMARLHKKGGAQVDCLQLLSMYSGDRKCYNEIIDILSLDNGDSLPLLQQKLYQKLFEGYCISADPPLAYDKFSKVVDSFFYGENGNTFFFQEVIQQGAADTALPLPAFFIAKSMLSMLVRSIAGAAAHQAQSQEEKHAFAAHKQFRDVKFKQPETFTQQY